jgi:hypothetical protein
MPALLHQKPRFLRSQECSNDEEHGEAYSVMNGALYAHLSVRFLVPRKIPIPISESSTWTMLLHDNPIPRKHTGRILEMYAGPRTGKLPVRRPVRRSLTKIVGCNFPKNFNQQSSQRQNRSSKTFFRGPKRSTHHPPRELPA